MHVVYFHYQISLILELNYQEHIHFCALSSLCFFFNKNQFLMRLARGPKHKKKTCKYQSYCQLQKATRQNDWCILPINHQAIPGAVNNTCDNQNSIIISDQDISAHLKVKITRRVKKRHPFTCNRKLCGITMQQANN